MRDVGRPGRAGAGRRCAGAELGCRTGGRTPPGGPHQHGRGKQCGWWPMMHSVGALILFCVLGAVICAKARVTGGAVVFTLIGTVLFVSTPAGGGVRWSV